MSCDKFGLFVVSLVYKRRRSRREKKNRIRKKAPTIKNITKTPTAHRKPAKVANLEKPRRAIKIAKVRTIKTKANRSNE